MIMDREIAVLIHLGRLQQASRDLDEKLRQPGMPTTLWFDVIPSGGGVLVQGFLDIELPNGNAISHDLDLSAGGSVCIVSASQTQISPEGRDVLRSTGDMECTTFEEWSSAVSTCERFFQESSINSSPSGEC